MMGEPYELDLAGEGDTMKAALRKLENDYGHDAVKDFLGADGFKNMHQMADVASDPIYNENANGILRQVLRGAAEGKKGKWVPSSLISTFAGLPFMKTLGALKAMGAAKGGVEAALPMMKYQFATNPRLGKLLSYAAKNGVSAKYAAPLISAALFGELNSSKQTEPQTSTEGEKQQQQKTPQRESMPTLREDAKPGPYITKLTPEEETKFQKWVKQNDVPMENDTATSDYDMRGYFKDNILGGKGQGTKVSEFDNRPHFPDTYKTPYHKTFSNESRYALPSAPHWDGDKLIDKNGKVIADETPKEKK
jgi:hypothetical protein